MIIGIISGIIAGFIAAKLTDGEGKGCIVDLFLGLVGGCFGGWVGQIITAVVGASILLWLWNKLK